MKSKILFSSIAFLCVAYAYSVGNNTKKPQVAYPEGFRGWQHVKSGMIGPKSKAFEQFGGFHHIYGNTEAMKGYENGIFPQGAILVFDKFEALDDNNGNVTEGKRTGVDVMIKDIRYDSTGGWGFEEFIGDSKTERAQRAAVVGCYNCHSHKKANDFVFSTMRK